MFTTLTMTRRVNTGRIEVLTGTWSLGGAGRRIRKARIVAGRPWCQERVCRRLRGAGEICSQQVFGWRRTMRQDLASAAGTTATPGFVPIVSEAVPAAMVQRTTSAAPGIEVKLAGAVVRVSSGMEDAAQLTAVLRAVRASASRT